MIQNVQYIFINTKSRYYRGWRAVGAERRFSYTGVHLLIASQVHQINFALAVTHLLRAS